MYKNHRNVMLVWPNNCAAAAEVSLECDVNTIIINIIIIIIIYLTSNGFLPGDSGNTIRHNIQYSPSRSNKAEHTKLHNKKLNYITVRVTYYTQ
jgi:hypothetical protein